MKIARRPSLLRIAFITLAAAFASMLFGSRFTAISAPVAATPNQTWEYKTLSRARAFDDSNGKTYPSSAADWGRWTEDSKELQLPVDLNRKLAQLGADGWELVTVESRSDKAIIVAEGNTSYCPNNKLLSCTVDAHLAGFSTAGVTTSDLWVFKRRRQ